MSDQIGVQGSLQLLNATILSVPENADWVDVTVGVDYDIYVFKSGGTSGTILKNIRLNFSDNSKEQLISAGIV